MTLALQLHNTKTRSKEVFKPSNAQHITMYVCGPTVYNLVHIGNARPAVVFDTLFRVLQALYPKVTYARNITDIDDKIMKAAEENEEPIDVLASRFTQEYQKDMAALGNMEPTVTPHATHHVGEMIQMVQTLVEKGHAYAAEGHVLFEVKSMADYGKLSNRALEDMLEGARVEVADYKRYAGDFVLWKPSLDTEPGWDSPWGRGRPGWHLECSAMIEKHLGETIDIHGGGRDLIFPHHENELAQSQCAHGGKNYVNYWLHNGYINIDGTKMSKSLGNFKTVRDLLAQFPGEAIRFALLSAQYRSEMDFSAALLEQSKSAVDSVYAALRRHTEVDVSGIKVSLGDSAVFKALLDDLNTPLAISHIHALIAKLNKNEDVAETKAELLAVGHVMGLFQQNADAWFQAGTESEVDATAIEALIAERQQAKLDKNYARADAIRAELTELGVVLEDSREGTKWRWAD